MRREHGIDRALQRIEVALVDIPKRLQLYAPVRVSQLIAKIGDLPPWDGSMFSFPPIRQMTRCLADDFEETFKR
jgi:hypothetical protein